MLARCPTVLLVVLAALAAGAGSAAAQDAGPRFRRLSLADGLSQSSVLATLRDHRGVMWVGTEDGLNRLDGTRVTVFKHDPVDAGSLSDSYVTALLEDRRGRLWVGTSDGGLNRLDPVTGRAVAFRHDPEQPASLPHDRVTGLAEDAAGRLWIATRGGGLARLALYGPDERSGRFDRFAPDTTRAGTQPSLNLWTLALDRAGRLWIATRGDGLVRLDDAAGAGGPTGPLRARFAVYRHDPSDPSSLPGDDLLGLDADASGCLWVGAFGGGLGRLDPGASSFVTYRHDLSDPASLPSDAISAVLRDRRGTVWVGTWGAGLARLPSRDASRLDGRARFERIVPDPTDGRSLPDGYVRSLAEMPDAAGLVWVGTVTGGAAIYRPSAAPFRHVRRMPGHAAPLADDYVRAFAETPDGRLWVGTRAGLCAEATPGTAAQGFACIGTPGSSGAPPDGLYVRALAADADGTLWVGGPDALYARSPGGGTLRRYAPADDGGDGSAHRVYALHIGRDGLLWVGAKSGLWGYDRATGQFVRHLTHDAADDESLSDDEVFALAETPDGALWAGTARGLNRIDRETGRVRRYRPRVGDARSLAHDRVLGLTVTRGGRLWASTVAGLCRLDDAARGRFTRVGVRQGLADDLAYAALEDAQGRLWVSSNRGLNRLDPTSGAVRQFSTGDGLQSDEFNQGAAFRTAVGDLAFGGVAGYSRFRPTAFRSVPPAPPLALTGIRVMDRPRRVGAALAAGQPVRIGPGENVIAFDFAALEYGRPDAVRYRYRLDGFENGWRDARQSRTASFTNLAGGRYTFRVQAADADGRWGAPGLAVPLVVTPPWWAMGWARVLGVLLALGLGLAWHRARIRDVERRRDEAAEVSRRLADAREAERLHLARELHDGPMQDLLSVNLRLSALAPDDAALDDVKAGLAGVRRQLRDTCGALRPPGLGPFGLGAALRAHADALGRAHPDVHVVADVDDDGQALPEPVRLGLFRIAQEALRNALRHAAPSVVTVRLWLGGDAARLEVEDDGRGFTPPARFVALAREGHYGLLGMAERASALGARLDVGSAPGLGTTIRVTVPTGPEASGASAPSAPRRRSRRPLAPDAAPAADSP